MDKVCGLTSVGCMAFRVQCFCPHQLGRNISWGHSVCANTVSFGTFSGFCELLVQCTKILSRGGGGGGCVYFLKSVRKGRFRNVWVGGGGDDHIFEQTELHSGRCTRQGNARGTTDYSESKSSSVLPPFQKGRNPIGAHIPLLVNWNKFLQFFPILQPACLDWHPPCVERHGPQTVHVALFGQLDLAPRNGLTVP